jgi:hypothetical protein
MNGLMFSSRYTMLDGSNEVLLHNSSLSIINSNHRAELTSNVVAQITSFMRGIQQRKKKHRSNDEQEPYYVIQFQYGWDM